MQEKLFSPPTLIFLIKKLDHNLGLHAKNQREISKNEIRRPSPFVWKCGHFPLILIYLGNPLRIIIRL